MADGKKCKITIESGEQLHERLISKLVEEVDEFREDNNITELADIITVVIHLAKSLGFTEDDLIAEYTKKKNERGGFDKGVILKSVILKTNHL